MNFDKSALPKFKNYNDKSYISGYRKKCSPFFFLLFFLEKFRTLTLPCFNEKPMKNNISFLNTLVSNAPFFYPLKTPENPKVFWYFQGVEKGWIGNKWVKKDLRVTGVPSNLILEIIIPYIYKLWKTDKSVLTDNWASLKLCNTICVFRWRIRFCPLGDLK